VRGTRELLCFSGGSEGSTEQFAFGVCCHAILLIPSFLDRDELSYLRGILGAFQTGLGVEQLSHPPSS
jgi:hypothetical protein